MAPLLLSIAIFVIVASVHPYQNTVANYTESLLFLWLVCLLGLGNSTSLGSIKVNPKWPNALLYFPVAVGLVVLAINSIILAR